MSSTKVPRKLKAHLFVCTNQRPDGHPRGCCHSKGAEALLQTFKEAVSKAGLQGEVRAQKAGCLDTCELGPTVVIYPDDTWYGGIDANGAKEIVESHLLRGQPVDRLRIPGK